MIWIIIALCFILAWIVLVQGNTLKRQQVIQDALVKRCVFLWKKLPPEVQASVKATDAKKK